MKRQDGRVENNGPKPVSEVTVERRTVIQWFGKAAVLGLSSPLLLACQDGEFGNGSVVRVGSDSDTGVTTDDTRGTDAPLGSDVDTGSDTDSGTGSDTHTGTGTDTGVDTDAYPFSPGPGHPLLDEFVVFTVDEQKLVDILNNWKLQIDGLVRNPITLTFGQLREMTVTNQVTDFHCVTGWSVNDVPWVGVTIGALLDLVNPLESASHITYHCQGDIYTESTTIEEALEPKSIMAYGVGESSLPLDHGFPLRLVIPRKLGYKNAKYIYRIELTEHPHFGFWENRGYSYEADVSANRLRDGKY